MGKISFGNKIIYDDTKSGGGSSTFVELEDTPESYVGEAGKVATVSPTEDGLVYSNAPPSENGLPVGGTTGQILAKVDDTDNNVEWVDVVSGGGIAKLPLPFASSEFSDSYRVGYAFDNNLSTFWSAEGAIGQFIGINFRDDVLVSKISIVDVRARLKDFIFEGSIDNVNYNELLNTTHPQVTTKVEYDIPTSVGYIYFRVRCTSALHTGANMGIDELEMEYQVL